MRLRASNGLAIWQTVGPLALIMMRIPAPGLAAQARQIAGPLARWVGSEIDTEVDLGISVVRTEVFSVGSAEVSFLLVVGSIGKLAASFSHEPPPQPVPPTPASIRVSSEYSTRRQQCDDKTQRLDWDTCLLRLSDF